MAGVALDVTQVFWYLILLFYFVSIDSGGWMTLMASLMIMFVFFGCLGLRLIRRRGGLGLSLVLGGLIAGLLVGVLLVFFR